ncbi:MAG: hypothetical protein K0U84_13530 [Actinomycetia bacterium]|nr:hypothetical protein [Actinomycetes bacterium]
MPYENREQLKARITKLKARVAELEELVTDDMAEVGAAIERVKDENAMLTQQVAELQQQVEAAPHLGDGSFIVRLEGKYLDYLDAYRRSTCYQRGIHPDDPQGWTLGQEVEFLIKMKYAQDPARTIGSGAATGPKDQFNAATGSW